MDGWMDVCVDTVSMYIYQYVHMYVCEEHVEVQLSNW